VSSEVTNQKIHIIREVVADRESDNMVVTTLVDMFNVRKAISKDKLVILVGSMSNEVLIQLSCDRYNSHFWTIKTENHIT
jgi:hypothetical protein